MSCKSIPLIKELYSLIDAGLEISTFFSAIDHFLTLFIRKGPSKILNHTHDFIIMPFNYHTFVICIYSTVNFATFSRFKIFVFFQYSNGNTIRTYNPNTLIIYYSKFQLTLSIET